jgi:glycosyltransferase involved in cell wall biosynthesis
MTDISVVIATFNRMELLRRTLPALVSLRSDGVEHEVLFLDDGSTDESRLMIESEARRSSGRIRYLALPHSGSPGRPRNVGIREAKGRVILLLDDDVIPDPELVLKHWAFHQRNPGKEVAALGELYLSDEARSDPMSLFHTSPYDEVRRKEKLDYLFFWTGNLSLKRAFMLEHGLFDEDPALHPLEDMECGYRLFAQGLRLEFLPEATGAHEHKLDPVVVPQKGLRTGRAQFALVCKVPDIGLKERFRILSPDLSSSAFFWRLMRRAFARAVDNPLTLGLLRGLGAERSKRNWVTDLYYFLIFRRNVLAGYKAAKKEHQRLQTDSISPEGFSRCER